MTQRTTARHRSEQPVSTPLTTLGDSLTDTLSTIPAVAGRGGMVVALSSGLVASMSVPAAAAPLQDRAPQTASVPVLTTAPAALATQAVSAPANATVDFEHSAFRADARAHVAPRTAGTATRDVTRISRSLATAAYRAELDARAAAAKRAAAARAAASVSTSRSSAPSRSTASAPTTTTKAGGSTTSRGASVIAIASRYLGVPYVYGGASPRGFDCSGLTMYVYAQLGYSLPRSAAAQYGATTRISRSQAVPGDLIFFFTGGTVTHVAIYLGGNMMLAAPHTGDVVKRESIYSANIAFGRV